MSKEAKSGKMSDLLETLLQAVAHAKEPSRVTLHRTMPLPPDVLFDRCAQWPKLWIEQNADGDVLIGSPVGAETGARRATLTGQLGEWAKQDGTGRVFGSLVGWTLPSGAVRSPSASWVRSSRLAPFTPEQWQGFLPLCPDFVAEMLLPFDRLTAMQAKMHEYIQNGAKLGVLIDPERRQVTLYRPNQAAVVLNAPEIVLLEPEIPGFTLNLSEIWSPF